ncbi:class I adenylate-forming enzyme family protein [Dermatobacter hominis]|uniref:class I adenylate-forming enzyme family protein n=1 Tax=Dermatobacter hominis TaxID=2884263 RepID=UPI001D1082E2|nr:AMP-binding protein [Dermatobacter hominis]UDY37085.1 AMP-binding protein [Dermatobacter hominis]
MPTATEIRAQLTGPGGPFEIVEEKVDDQAMRVYKDRFNDLRVVASFGQSHGDKVFIVRGDERITYREFMRGANSVSRRLAAIGVGHGDRVAVLSQNNPEWCLTFWGTVDIGAVLVGLNGWWITDEVVYGLEDSGARVLVADRKRFERIVDEFDGIDTLEHVFLIDADPSDFAGPDGSVSPKLHRFDELLTEPTDDLPTEPIDEGDPAVIFYTSGTTGRPKGAISTHRNMIANLQNTVFLLTLGAMVQATDPDADQGPEAPSDGTGQPVALLTSPLFHVSGCHSVLVVGMMAGLRLVILPGRFTPEAAFDAIEKERIQLWATVPTMIWRCCEHPDRHDWDLSSITSVSFGGSPSADELQRRIRETFPNVKATTNAYGLTESSSAATALTGRDSLERPDSVGLPMPNTELAIAGPDGTHLGAGATGEVLIRGPLIMAGYWNKPEATASTVIDGWLHTGDVGHLDEDGYLYITDRAKDMLIRGGENVYCVEIENRLVEHPSIADAAVVGVPHPELGEEVKAVIELAPGEEISDADLRTWVAETLAAFKVPAYVQRWDGKLPRNASGKLLKNVIRGEGEVSFAETM